MSYLEDYCNDILNEKINSCEKIKQVCAVLKHDIENPDRWHFDEKKANRHIQFIEKFCKVPSGNIGAPLKLEDFQKAWLQAIFGFVDDEGLRKYNEVFIICGRKNGKTTLLSAILLDLLINDKEGSPQCVTVSTKLDQAKLSFNAAHKMVQQSPLLKGILKKRVTDLYYSQNMGYIKPLASNSNSLDGLDIHGCICDELAAWKDPDIYSLMKQATSARKQPLVMTITTNNFIREGIFDTQYAYAANILNGTATNPRFLPFIYELDNVDEWDDENSFIKANPGLGTIKSMEYMQEIVQKAKDDPSFKSTVLTKEFNLTATGFDAWLPFDAIMNETVADMDYLSHSYCVAGVDLSSVRDLSSVSLIIRKPDDNNFYILNHCFIPQAKLDDLAKSQVMEAPYKIWEEQGWLTINEGAQVDYSLITQWFVDMVNKYDIRPLWIGYDRALANYWSSEMQETGFEIEPVAQGPYTWSYSFKEMAATFTEHRVIYQNNPVLRWCMCNTAIKSLNKDGIETIQPVKIQQNRRIDALVATLNAWVIYNRHMDEFIPYLR